MFRNCTLPIDVDSDVPTTVLLKSTLNAQYLYYNPSNVQTETEEW